MRLRSATTRKGVVINMESQPDDQALLAQAAYYDEESKRQTPAQAKDKAVADLTAACYQQASQLKLTPEEIKSLSADFADDCFQPGAAGKENLIYIEHAALRERLDSVIGMGQWCIIPIRRWVEEFTYEKDEWLNNKRTGKTIPVKGSHVYVDGIMLIRGAFVASAIGEMTYYPDNHTQNYGDAVEGAETAALRRCCKRLGIGLQAWRKDWCAGWWARKQGKTTARAKTPPVDTTQGVKVPEKGNSAPNSGTPDENTAKWAKLRMKLLNKLEAAPGQRNRVLLTDYLTAEGVLTPQQVLEDLPTSAIPLTSEGFDKLLSGMQDFDMKRSAAEAETQ